MFIKKNKVIDIGVAIFKLLLILLFIPDVNALGSEDFYKRHSKFNQLSGTYKSIVVSWLGENSDDPEIRLRCDLLKRSCPKFIPLINLKAMLFLTCSDLNVNKMECSWWSCEENKKVLGEVADKLKLYEVNKYTLPWNTPSELGGVFYLTKYCRVSAMLFRYLNYFKESIKWNWF